MNGSLQIMVRAGRLYLDGEFTALSDVEALRQAAAADFWTIPPANREARMRASGAELALRQAIAAANSWADQYIERNGKCPS